MCYCGYLCNLTELRYTELFNQPLDWAHGQEGSGELTGGKTQKATQTYILKAIGLDHSAAGILYQSYLHLHVSCCCWAKASQTCMFYTFHKFYSTDYCTYFRAQAGIPMCWGGCLVIWGESKHMGVYRCSLSMTPSCLPLKQVIHYNPRKIQEVMHVSRIILCINA